MEYRGPILIVFAMSLVASPLAIRNLQLQAEVDASAVAVLETDGAADASCQARRIETSSYAIGCKANEYAQQQRRVMPDGGAYFVSVNN